MTYERMNINFMVVWGKDILDHYPIGEHDDEKAISEIMPKALNRRELPLFLLTLSLFLLV